MNEPRRGSNGLTPSRDHVADPDDATARRVPPRQRNRRLFAGALAIVVALVSFVALTRAFTTGEPPADEPTPPRAPSIFSEVGGWIADGDKSGIWAVDPTRPGDPNDRIQMSSDRGAPTRLVE
jgi:hypothetical protein